MTTAEQIFALRFPTLARQKLVTFGAPLPPEARISKFPKQPPIPSPAVLLRPPQPVLVSRTIANGLKIKAGQKRYFMSRDELLARKIALPERSTPHPVENREDQLDRHARDYMNLGHYPTGTLKQFCIARDITKTELVKALEKFRDQAK